MHETTGQDARHGGEAEPTIVVPLDGSAQALVALPVARGMAQIEGATVHIVHVGEPITPPLEALRRLGLSPEQLQGTVIDQTTGSPAQGITRLVSQMQSCLIVMSTHTGAMEVAGELGPVAEEVLRSAPCPVALVRPERGLDPWALQRILLPMDGTPSTAEAAGPATDLALRAGAELVVLHVAVPGAAPPPEPGTYTTPRYVDQPQHEWPAWADEFLERMQALAHPRAGVGMRLFLSRGSPAAAIVQFARDHEVDIIVLGWHGQLRPEHAEIAKAVIHQAPCPVMTVRVGRGR